MIANKDTADEEGILIRPEEHVLCQRGTTVLQAPLRGEEEVKPCACFFLFFFFFTETLNFALRTCIGWIIDTLAGPGRKTKQLAERKVSSRLLHHLMFLLAQMNACDALPWFCLLKMQHAGIKVTMFRSVVFLLSGHLVRSFTVLLVGLNWKTKKKKKNAATHRRCVLLFGAHLLCKVIL